MIRTQPTQKWLIWFSRWIFIGLLAYMPLHIFLSTWLGTSFHILTVTRILKDVVLVAGFVPLVLVSVKQPWFKTVLRSKLLWLMGFYCLLTLMLALVRSTDKSAEVLGIVYNTRFLIFFIYGLLLTKLTDSRLLRRDALKAVLGSALVVLVFGVIQYTLLPNNALAHVGYVRSNGVLPAFFIDDKPNLERIMSTIRDPNSFGSYVLIIISLTTALYIKRTRYRRFASGFIMLSLLCLWFSFSRSAWIGLICSIGAVLVFGYGKFKVPKKPLIAAVISLTFIIGLAAFSMRNTYFVQNAVFHADKTTILEDPNQLRIRFWRESVTTIVKNPLGKGPGTAGIVSIRNKVQGGQLNENYYLQIATEVGLVGIALFMAIIGSVGFYLTKIKKDWLALGLLGAFAGLLVTNFLVHIWSNEAVAYTWWGLVGLVLSATLIPNKKRSKSS